MHETLMILAITASVFSLGIAVGWKMCMKSYDV